MKRILTLSILLFVTAILHAQFSHGSIPLTFHNKPDHIQKLPFNKVIVLDNRLDSSNFLIDETNWYGPEMDGFSMPASKEISGYIEKAIAAFPKNKRVVYINLKQLRFGNLIHLSYTLFFSAEAYIVKSEGLSKIYSEKKTYSFRHTYGNTISTALNHFIKGICNNYYLQSKPDTNTYTLDEVNKNVMCEWASYPIIKQSDTMDGAYRSMDDFRDNKLVPVKGFKLQMNKDSTYHLSCEPAVGYKSETYFLLLNSWAISYKGNLYIPIMHEHFIPLSKVNNSFSFYIPKALPDMYAIIYKGPTPSGDYGGSGGSVGLEGINFGNSNNVKAGAILIGFGVIIVVAITVKIIKTLRENHSHIEKAKPDALYHRLPRQDMRYCFLDMDTGDIIYH